MTTAVVPNERIFLTRGCKHWDHEYFLNASKSWFSVPVHVLWLLCKFVHDPCKCVVLCLSCLPVPKVFSKGIPDHMSCWIVLQQFLLSIFLWTGILKQHLIPVNKYFNSSKYFFLYHSQNVTLGHLAVIFSTFIKFYANKIGSDSI